MEPVTSKVVRIDTGNVPIIITIPHGIGETQSHYYTNLQERSAGIKREELELFTLTSHLQERMNSIVGNPYIVIAQIHRSRIDFNRSKEYVNGERAYDDPYAEPLYDLFEHSLSKVIEEALRGSDFGLLIDLHGCRTDESDVFIGTLNGETVYQYNGHIFGKDTLREHLTHRGWRVSPRTGHPETVFTGRSDGIINRHNISRRRGRYSSIQLEVSRAVRLDPNRNRTFANDLADAIVELFR